VVARLHLVAGGYGIFEVEDDRVRAGRERLVEAVRELGGRSSTCRDPRDYIGLLRSPLVPSFAGLGSCERLLWCSLSTPLDYCHFTS
jgi:hypothetical protein